MITNSNNIQNSVSTANLELIPHVFQLKVKHPLICFSYFSISF